MKSIPSNDVIEMIKRIWSQFPKMSFRYSFDGASQQHVIDTLPEDLFESPDFEEIANNEMVIFGKKFPNESLLFTCKDPNFTVGVAEFELMANEIESSATPERQKRKKSSVYVSKEIVLFVEVTRPLESGVSNAWQIIYPVDASQRIVATSGYFTRLHLEKSVAVGRTKKFTINALQ